MGNRHRLFLLLIIIVSGIFSLLYYQPQVQGKEGEKMASEKGGKALMIIAHKDFRDEEFKEPKAILEENGYIVDVASSSTDTAKGMLGFTFKPNLLLSDVEIENYSAIVFVGGAGSKEYWNDKRAHEIARKTVESGKVLGAICIAPVTLANAGLLKGKNATVFYSEANALTAKGAKYTGKDVEKDGLIITASGPAAAKDFGLALIKALDSQFGH